MRLIIESGIYCIDLAIWCGLQSGAAYNRERLLFGNLRYFKFLPTFFSDIDFKKENIIENDVKSEPPVLTIDEDVPPPLLPSSAVPTPIPASANNVVPVITVEDSTPVNNENEHRQTHFKDQFHPPSSVTSKSSTASNYSSNSSVNTTPFTPQQQHQHSSLINLSPMKKQPPPTSISTSVSSVIPPLPPPPASNPIVFTKKEWDHEERRKVETRNNNMRQIIYKEVKRPGRNYDRLLELLRGLHGPSDIRQQYIKDVIREAMRFKRQHLAKIIEQNMSNLVSVESPT